MALQVMLGARYQARLLPHVDTLRPGPIVDAIAKPDFDESDCHTVSHDQIDLSVSATIVARYQPEPMVNEVFAGEVFGPGSAFRGAYMGSGHQRIGVDSFVSIRGLPFWNRAHNSRRSILLCSLSESLPVTP